MIVNTAIPKITDDFKSVGDIGWYGSGYQLTTSAFQLLFGKIYSFYSTKVTFLATIFLFEVGSAISGAAPNSVAFIVGRAIAGIGGAGIASGAVCITQYLLLFLREDPSSHIFFIRLASSYTPYRYKNVRSIKACSAPSLELPLSSDPCWEECSHLKSVGGGAFTSTSLLVDLSC